jgi:hypothetical protein
MKKGSWDRTNHLPQSTMGVSIFRSVRWVWVSFLFIFRRPWNETHMFPFVILFPLCNGTTHDRAAQNE